VLVVLVVVSAAAARPLVADVGGMPISKASFDHWMAVAAHAGQAPPGHLIPHRYSPRWKALRTEVMQFLITAKWIAGEARLLGIGLSDSAVEREYQRTRRLAFPTRRAFLRFLREAGESTGDLRYRVRIDMLSNRIRRKVTAPYKNPAAKQKAFGEFVVAFQRRWRAQTSCGGPYWIEDCGRALESR